MLTINPDERYSVNDIKNHPWLMLTNSPLTSERQSIPNCQLTNAILEHAESLGYNRTQILRSVNGNSYDSDAAIWHLLLEKFQENCQINSKTTVKFWFERRKSLYFFSDSVGTTNEQSTDLVDHSIESRFPSEVDVEIEELENYSDSDSDDEIEEVSEQLREQYVRTHGLRRHTAGRMALLTHNPPIRTVTPNVRFDPQSRTIEPTLLTNRLNHLQQQRQYNTLVSTPENEQQQFYPELPSNNSHQRYPHSTSYNGLCLHSNITAVSEACNEQQKPNYWLSPPMFNHLRMFFTETFLSLLIRSLHRSKSTCK